MKREDITRRARARYLDAYRMRVAGLTLKEIGVRIGRIADGGPLTPEQARQFVARGYRIVGYQRTKNALAAKTSKAEWRFNGRKMTFKRTL